MSPPALPTPWLLPLLEGQGRILERVAEGTPLPGVLDDLCRLVEALLPGRRCAILTVAGGALRMGSAPSLPEAFNEAVDGSALGPGATPCGLAAATVRPVVVTDFLSDPAWAHTALLAKRLGLASCLSLPIPGGEGAAIGTFALYGTQPGAPTTEEQALLEACTGLASAVLRGHARETGIRALLVQSEAHYRQTFLNLPVPSFIWDPETQRFLAVNAAALQTYGYTAAEFLGLRLPDLRFSEDLPRMDEVLRRMPRGYHRAGPVRHRTKHGDALVVDLSSHDVVFEGRPARVTVAQDITEQLQMEARYRQLVEAISEGIAIVDETDHFEFANPAAHRVYGMEPGTLTGRSLAEFLPAGQMEIVHQETLRRQKGQSSSYQLTIRRPDGEERLLSVNAVPRLQADGTYKGAFVVFQDITDRVATEQALRRSEHRFRKLFEAIPLAVVIHQKGLIQYANLAALRAVGLEHANQALGAPIQQFIPPGDLPLVAERQRALMAGQEVGWMELHHLRADGTPFPVDSRILVLEAGPSPVFLSVFQDISERKRTEEGMRQAQKLESLGVLAGGIAHDFNNLLTAMMGNLNLAQDALPVDHALHAYLQNLELAVTRASDLTRQMLAYSGRGRFVVKPLDLNRMVQDMANLLKVSISKRVDLQMDLPEALPWMEGDASQLQQVVMNLVINGSEALGDGDGWIRVRTRTETFDAPGLARHFPGQNMEPGAFVCLEVQDSGEGIPPEQLPRIFDPFYTTKSTGRGLGLSALQGILRGHKAGIHLESRVGEGTCFRLYFPASARPVDAPAPAPPAEPARPTGGRILLVDDEAALREPLADMLGLMGFEVLEAADGVEALDRYEAVGREVRAAILDLTMPRMDGRQTLAALRERNPDLPVLLSSGYEEGEAERLLQGSGPTGFLQKPYTLKALRKAVMDLLPPE